MCVGEIVELELVAVAALKRGDNVTRDHLNAVPLPPGANVGQHWAEAALLQSPHLTEVEAGCWS